MKCWSSHCQNKLEFFCPCKSPRIYSCDSHMVAHLKTKAKSGHHPEPLTYSLNTETKEALIDFLRKSLSDLYEFKRNTVNDSLMKIKEINDKMKTTLKSVDQAINEQLKIIFQINLLESVSNVNKNKLDELLLLEPEESIERLKDSFNILDKSNLFIDDSGKLIKKNRFVLFRDNSTKIVQAELYDNSWTEFTISLGSPKSMYISMCLIPDDSIFCFGNYPTPSNNAFVIESSNRVRAVNSVPINLGLAGSIYYENHVYVFGAWQTDRQLNSAYKYNLWENKWERLNDLPAISVFVSCFAKNNKILLSGREHSKIYIYSVIQNLYRESYNVQASLRKIVCGNDKNAYVVEAGGNIYESNHEWEVWNRVGSSGIQNTEVIGYKVLWKNKVYFAYNNYDLYEFDLKEKKIQKIKALI